MFSRRKSDKKPGEGESLRRRIIDIYMQGLDPSHTCRELFNMLDLGNPDLEEFKADIRYLLRRRILYKDGEAEDRRKQRYAMNPREFWSPDKKS